MFPLFRAILIFVYVDAIQLDMEPKIIVAIILHFFQKVPWPEYDVIRTFELFLYDSCFICLPHYNRDI